MTPPDELARELRSGTDTIRRLPVERILNALDRVHAAWSTQEGVAAVSGLVSGAIGYPQTTVQLSISNLCSSLRRPRLEQWLEASGIRLAWLDGELDEARTLVFGPRLTLVVAGGNIPGAALPSVVQVLLLKSPVLVKAPSAEPALMPAYAAALAEADAEVGQALAVTTWKGGDAEIEAALLPEVDALIAYASDATLRSLRARIPAHARFLGYGHRISLTAVGREYLVPDRLRALASALARDACLFDQQGCLSPHAVYVEEGGALTPVAVAEALAASLAQAASALPRRLLDPDESAAIHQYRAAVEMEAVSGGKARLWTSAEGTAWTVILNPDPRLSPTPGNRTVVVRPIADLELLPEIIEPVGSGLISCGLAVADHRRPRLVRGLGAAGITRFTTPGHAQLPEDAFYHDGVSALGALARFVHLEASPNA